MLAELAHTVTIADASRRAGAHVNTIRNWIAAGRVQAIETPYGRLIDARSLEEFLRTREGQRETPSQS